MVVITEKRKAEQSDPVKDTKKERGIVLESVSMSEKQVGMEVVTGCCLEKAESFPLEIISTDSNESLRMKS